MRPLLTHSVRSRIYIQCFAHGRIFTYSALPNSTEHCRTKQHQTLPYQTSSHRVANIREYIHKEEMGESQTTMLTRVSDMVFTSSNYHKVVTQRAECPHYGSPFPRSRGGGPLQPNSFWGKWEYNVWMCQLVNTEGARGRPTVRAGHAHLARKSHYCQKWMGSDNNLVKHNQSNHTNHIEINLEIMKST